MVMVVQAADQLANYTQEVLGFARRPGDDEGARPRDHGLHRRRQGRLGRRREIGSMKVNDEIAALRTMDIDPSHSYPCHASSP